jgi:hypothetical protein
MVSSLKLGEAVPIPTLPPPWTRNLGEPATWKFKKSPEKEAGLAAMKVPEEEPEVMGSSVS